MVVDDACGWKYLLRKGMALHLVSVLLDSILLEGRGCISYISPVPSTVLGPEERYNKCLLNHKEMSFNFPIFPLI